MWGTWAELSEGWNKEARDIIHVILSAAVVVPVVFILSIVVWLLRIMNEKVPFLMPFFCWMKLLAYKLSNTQNGIKFGKKSIFNLINFR